MKQNIYIFNIFKRISFSIPPAERLRERESERRRSMTHTYYLPRQMYQSFIGLK